MSTYTEIDKKDDNEDSSIVVVDGDLEAGIIPSTAEETAVLKNDDGECEKVTTVSSVAPEKKANEITNKLSIENSEKFINDTLLKILKEPNSFAKSFFLKNCKIVKELQKSCIVEASLSCGSQKDIEVKLNGSTYSESNELHGKKGEAGKEDFELHGKGDIIKVRLFTHFDTKSVLSTIKAEMDKLKYEDTTDEVNDVTMSDGSLQVRTQEVKQLVSSTNDYLYSEDMGLKQKLISLAVSFFQLGCLVSIITTNLGDGEVHGPRSGIAVFLFIVPSVVAHMSITMSELLGETFYDALDGLFSMELTPWDSFNESTFKKVLSIYALPLLIPIELIRDFDVVGVSLFIELCLVITTVFATCVVLVSDPQPLSILFNFAGITVVLEIDDKIATFFNYSAYVNKLYVENAPKKVSYDDDEISSKAVVAICIAVPVFIYIYVNLLM